MTVARPVFILIGDGEFIAGHSPDEVAFFLELQDVGSGLYRVIRDDGNEVRAVVGADGLRWEPTPGPPRPEDYRRAITERIDKVGLERYGLTGPIAAIPWPQIESAVLATELAQQEKRIALESLSLRDRFMRMVRRRIWKRPHE